MRLPRENAYQCQYGCVTTTVDVDDGITPFMIKCVAKSTPDRPIEKKYLDENGECIGIAKSTMYPKTPRPKNLPAPTHEWYRPTDKNELLTLSLEEKEHVDQGGLLLRPRTNATPRFWRDDD